MNEKALSYLDNSDGWEIGPATNVVVLDEGAGASLTTTSAKVNILVFFIDQMGLMDGIHNEGRNITQDRKSVRKGKSEYVLEHTGGRRITKQTRLEKPKQTNN